MSLLKCGDTWGNDTLRPKGSGTPTDPITIGFYGTGHKPILDGLDDTQDRIGIHLVDVEGYKITGLGIHTIKIIVKGTKQAASRDAYVVIDAFDIQPGPATP